MNRETQRQIRRLERLADFIEANPEKYNQSDCNRCVVGLGARLYKNRLREVFEVRNLYVQEFAERYGIGYSATCAINGGDFNYFGKQFDSNFNSEATSPATAVTLLRYIANQKRLDKVV